ncbi:MAG: TRAP transporter large permease subunit, partial [Alphaproteobacteria bacterium]|nr:TRAP transporter large permease subunit [Alphaproteobacteria bacterium]
GTHVDAPRHFGHKGTVDAMPPGALIGPCRVVTVRARDLIRAEHIERADLGRTERVLFKTRNSSRAGGTKFHKDFVALSAGAAAALVGLFGLVALIGWDAGSAMAGTVPHSKSAAYAFSVLPMFLLIGYLAFHAGLTDAIFDAARKWFSWAPGGLAVATVFATAGFAAVSGASTATAAVFARVAIPEMLSHGYDRRLAAGVVAA